MICWWNGSYVTSALPLCPLSDRGYTLGDGVFTTMLVEQDRAHYLPFHLRRLRRHADLIYLAWPSVLESLPCIVRDLLEKNHLVHGRAALRVTLSRSCVAPEIKEESGGRHNMPVSNAYVSRGLDISGSGFTNAAISLTPLEANMPASSSPFFRSQSSDHAPVSAIPVSAMIARRVRRDEYSLLSQIKSLSYLEPVMAMEEARRAGASNALMLNSRGRIACSANGNFYALIDGRWVTPALSEGAMGGIVRGILLESAVVEEGAVDEKNLHKITSAVLSNSLRGVTVLDFIDGRPLDRQQALQTFGKKRWEIEE